MGGANSLPTARPHVLASCKFTTAVLGNGQQEDSGDSTQQLRPCVGPGERCSWLFLWFFFGFIIIIIFFLGG